MEKSEPIELSSDIVIEFIISGKGPNIVEAVSAQARRRAASLVAAAGLETAGETPADESASFQHAAREKETAKNLSSKSCRVITCVAMDADLPHTATPSH